jgi:hypothetical protein
MSGVIAEGTLVIDWEPQSKVEIDWQDLEHVTGVALPELAQFMIQDAADRLTSRGPVVDTKKLRRLYDVINELNEDELEYLDCRGADIVSVREALAFMKNRVPQRPSPFDMAIIVILWVYEGLGVKTTGSMPLGDEFDELQPALKAAYRVCCPEGCRNRRGHRAFAQYAIRKKNIPLEADKDRFDYLG